MSITINHIAILVRLVVLVIGIISSVITANVLGPTGRGEIFSLITLATTIINFSYLGLPSSNTYLVSSNLSLLPSIFGNSLILSIFAGVTSMLAYFVYYEFDASLLLLKTVFIFFFVVTIMASNFQANLLVAIGDIRSFVKVDLLQNLTTFIFYIIGYIYRTGVVYFLLVSLIGPFLSFLYSYFKIRAKIEKLVLEFNWTLFKVSLRYSLKVFITTFIGFFISRANVFLLQKTHTISEVGYFSISIQFYDAIGIIPSTMSILLFPNLVKLDSENRLKSMKTVLFKMASILFFICIISFFVIPIIINYLFGQEFAPSISIAQLLLPAAFFIGLTSIISQYLASMGYPISQVISWLLVLALWVPLSFYIVPTYGSSGVAFILIILNTLIFLILYFLSIRIHTNAKDY